jgi:hypothetical protein
VSWRAVEPPMSFCGMHFVEFAGDGAVGRATTPFDNDPIVQEDGCGSH